MVNYIEGRTTLLFSTFAKNQYLWRYRGLNMGSYATVDNADSEGDSSVTRGDSGLEKKHRRLGSQSQEYMYIAS